MFITEVRKIYVCVLNCAYNTYYNIRLSMPIINNVKSSNPDSLIIIIIINNDDNNVDFKEAIIIMLS